MKILITGAEGFIGLALVNLLVAESNKDCALLTSILGSNLPNAYALACS